MLRNQKVLDKLFEEASAAAEASISKIELLSRDNVISDELRLFLTTQCAGISAQLEILKILRSEFEPIVKPD
jgi:hypothetical protein